MMGIRKKLFIWISITFLLAIGMISYFSLPQIEHIVFDHATNVMSEKTEHVADNIDNWFVERGAILKSIALQMEINRLDTQNSGLPIFVNSMARRFNDEFDDIYTGFADKFFLGSDQSNLPKMSGIDPTGRQWYIDAVRKNSLVVTEPYTDIKTGQVISSIAYPIKTPIPGVIGTDIYLEDLHSFLNEAEYDDRAKIFLISKAGKLLYTNDDNFGTIGENFDLKEKGLFRSWIEQMMAGKEGICRFPWHGVAYYGIFVPIKTSGWSLVVSLPISAFFEESQTFIIRAVLIALVGIFLLFLVIYFIIKEITKPLEAISLTAQKLSNGDLQAKFEHSGTAEVEYLAHSLEVMRTNIVTLLEKKESLVETTGKQKEEIETLYNQTIKALAEAIEEKDDYTRGHCERVAYYSERIGRLLGWDEEQLKMLRHAAILHDIGKIGVPINILHKPGRLEPEEYEIIKSHPQLGYQILHNISSLEAVSIAVFQHHERVDGRGYPNGLKGTEIVPMAKIIMVADTYDAMTSDRAYRKAMTDKEARKELWRCAGTQFDEDIVKLFCESVLVE